MEPQVELKPQCIPLKYAFDKETIINRTNGGSAKAAIAPP